MLTYLICHSVQNVLENLESKNLFQKLGLKASCIEGALLANFSLSGPSKKKQALF